MREKLQLVLFYIFRGAALLSALLTLINGYAVVVETSGTVFGTEFGMLIMIANQLGYIMVVLSLYLISEVLKPREV